jgi:hypothetical protein
LLASVSLLFALGKIEVSIIKIMCCFSQFVQSTMLSRGVFPQQLECGKPLAAEKLTRLLSPQLTPSAKRKIDLG